MGTFSRIRTVVRAAVEHVVRKIEDPKKMVRQMVLDMEDALDDAVVAVAQAMANEKLLARRIAQKREESALWACKAEDAMDAGEEALARKALFLKVTVDEAVNTLQKAREEAEEVTVTLKQRLAELKAKLASARARQSTLAIRRQVVQEVRQDARVEAYDRFVRDVAREEATAEIYAEMVGSGDAQLEEEFDQLERKQRVEAEIQVLKEKIKQSARQNDESEEEK
ncbi:MAG: PspA/IM30 family protein [Gemmatimonadetes bacterium]|nr:PspA/IM30 family protein [Gemmatimonadota bacterium]